MSNKNNESWEKVKEIVESSLLLIEEGEQWQFGRGDIWSEFDKRKF